MRKPFTKAGPGRPKGSQNRVQKAAKDVIEEAAARLGGVDRVVSWAQEAPENERVFWGNIYPKLLPLTAHVKGSMEVIWPLLRSKLEP